MKQVAMISTIVDVHVFGVGLRVNDTAGDTKVTQVTVVIEVDQIVTLPEEAETFTLKQVIQILHLFFDEF